MPCSMHLDYETNRETHRRLVSEIGTFLEEVTGERLFSWELEGIRPILLNWEYINIDDLAAKLCDLLKKKDARRYSAKLQEWWKEHQNFDKKKKALSNT
jgi:hypothetical protein